MWKSGEPSKTSGWWLGNGEPKLKTWGKLSAEPRLRRQEYFCLLRNFYVTRAPPVLFIEIPS